MTVTSELTVEERLQKVEDALAVINVAIDEIVKRLIYLDQKADQTASQHWDLVDELSDSSSLDGPELEPDECDPPAMSEQGLEPQPAPRFRVA